MKKVAVLALVLFAISSSLSAQWWLPLPTDQANYDRDRALETMFKAVPVPMVRNAVERRMVAWKTLLLDDDNKIGYVYIMCAGVGPIGYYTIRGKVASLNSFMVPEVAYGNYSGLYDKPVADLDGTYGSNIDGVFFCTTDGAYVEIPTSGSLSYLFSDRLITVFSTAPLINGMNNF